MFGWVLSAPPTGLSDFNKIAVTVNKSNFEKPMPRIINNKVYKSSNKGRYRNWVKEISNFYLKFHDSSCNGFLDL